jgi:hypothetical protein
MKPQHNSEAVLTVTRRGLGVIVGFFMTLFAASAFVVAGSFLSVSDAPLSPVDQSAAVAALR